MSVHALACILGNGSEVGRSQSDGYQRLVLIAVGHRADDRGFAWPKIADLAKQANVHRSTVNRNLDDLITLGELRMFTRGHYRSPAYAMAIVDHPLSTQEIVDRLAELDDRAIWRERVIDMTTGVAIEVPIPGQASLDLGKRLSQSATISENDTAVSKNGTAQVRDQGKHATEDRENGQKQSSEEIVAERDEIVADSNEIVAVARRSSEPSENHQRTARAANLKIVAERDNLPGAVESELRHRARTRAREKGAHNIEGLASKIFTEDFDLLRVDLLEEKTREAKTRAIESCTTCDSRGYSWTDQAGRPVDHEDPVAHTAHVCDHQNSEGDPPTSDVRPVQPTSEGSPVGGAFHCAGCGDPADLAIGDHPACLNCFAAALDEVRK